MKKIHAKSKTIESKNKKILKKKKKISITTKVRKEKPQLNS
jgi:hypothetical protein